jgi:CRISPR/Cas system-associated exonuclease Cas4 (RecB family)
VNMPLLSIRGSILFLGDGKMSSVKGGESCIETDMKLLSEAIDRIKKEEFGPVKDRRYCKHCHYRFLCK